MNAGLGDANSAGEEVEYLNGPATSEWGAKRAANGHPQPYGIKYWNIGNEPYGWWQIGKTSLDYFMLKHNRFAEAMRRVDPSIVLIGAGAMPDQLHPKDVKENATLESIRHKFGTDAILDPKAAEGLPPSVEVMAVKGVGHMPHLEAASAVNERLGRFFESAEGRAG